MSFYLFGVRIMKKPKMRTEPTIPYCLRGKLTLTPDTDLEILARLLELEFLITKGILQCGSIEDVNEAQFNSWCEEFKLLETYLLA